MLARRLLRSTSSKLSGKNLSFTSTTSQFRRNASTLVLADRDGADAIAPDTRSVLSCAAKIGGPVTVLVTGGSDQAAQEAAKLPGVDAVLHAKGDDSLDHGVAENVTALVLACQNASNFTHILAPSNNWSKAIIPRLGALLDVQPISEVTDVHDENTFERVFYAGNAIATVEMNDSVKCMTVRTTAFEKVGEDGGSGAVSDAPAGEAVDNLTTWKSDEMTESDRPDLGSARVVVSGGRGLKSGDNFKMLEDLADKLEGAVGASRAAVDAGMVPNDMQIGQTGKVVAPELYIAVGLSGAIQHLAGMKDSKTIVCINKDPEAPIFQVSDYGLEADLFKAVPEMTEKL